jgi:hypothetical protein
MKLNSEQIERLYHFTRQHYVEYYDLQSELVDHLANAIEQQWRENPKLSFEDALHREFKKFGVFGFMDVVEKRQAYLTKKYNRLVLSNLKVFFSIPKIIGTIASVAMVFILLKFLQKDIPLLQIIFALLTIIFFAGILIISRKTKKQSQLSGKKWMFKEIIFGYSSMSGFINLPIQFALHLKGENYANWFLLLVSFLIILLALVEYIVLILIPSKADQYLKETYPEYELVNSL